MKQKPPTNLQAVNAAVSGRFDQVVELARQANVIATSTTRALVDFIKREQELTKIDLTGDNSVLVIRHPDGKAFTKEFIEGMANSLGRDVISLPRDFSLEGMSELEMNSFGWYRRDDAAQVKPIRCDQADPGF